MIEIVPRYLFSLIGHGFLLDVAKSTQPRQPGAAILNDYPYYYFVLTAEGNEGKLVFNQISVSDQPLRFDSSASAS